jgi:hypothetical protein
MKDEMKTYEVQLIGPDGRELGNAYVRAENEADARAQLAYAGLERYSDLREIGS